MLLSGDHSLGDAWRCCPSSCCVSCALLGNALSRTLEPRVTAVKALLKSTDESLEAPYLTAAMHMSSQVDGDKAVLKD